MSRSIIDTGITKDTLITAFNKLQFRVTDFSLVGIRRTIGVQQNRFDDLIGFFNGTDCKLFRATTDPGTHFLVKPMNPKGTGILVPGQYRDVYKLGFHQNRPDHPAFIQVKPMRVFRDNDRDAELDFDPRTIEAGLFGLNLHRANANSIARFVENHSAACQVVQNKAPHDLLRKLAEQSGREFFDYTLLLDTQL